MNKIKIKRLHDAAQLPFYATEHAAGADVVACIDEPIDIEPGECKLIPLGFSMELPVGYGAYLIPRSGLGHKHGIVLGNLVGLIDADYRGQVFVSVWNRKDSYMYCEPFTVNPGDRIAQMCIVETPQFEFEWIDELEETRRGGGGFGSTGV